MTRRKMPLYCSFCGKDSRECAYLISGPCVFICNECVESAREIGQQMLVENVVASVSADVIKHLGES